MDVYETNRRRGLWPPAFLWLPAGVLTTAVHYLSEAETTPGVWVMMLLIPAQSLLFLAPCGLPLALGCRGLWRLGYPLSAWIWGVGLGVATVAGSLVSGPLGPLVVPVCSVALSIPVWLVWWWLSRRDRF